MGFDGVSPVGCDIEGEMRESARVGKRRNGLVGKDMYGSVGAPYVSLGLRNRD